MDSIQVFIAAAIAIEGIISWGKTVLVEKKIQWPVVISLLCSFVLVYDLKLNIFSLLQISEACPIVGMCITAVAISRGTNYFYEFYSRFTNWKETA